MTYDVFVELMRDTSSTAYNTLLSFREANRELFDEYAARFALEG